MCLQKAMTCQGTCSLLSMLGNWGGSREQKEVVGGCQLEDGMVGFVFVSVRPGWSVEIRLERREGSGTGEGGYYLH